MRTFTISVGESRTATAWPNKTTSWEKLTARLSKCHFTHESAAEYKAMSKVTKGKVKDIGGFVGGTVENGGRRKADSVTARSLITLDIDYGTPGTVELVRELLQGTAWCLYSTHSHTKDTPRYRLVLPLSRDVTPEEYIPIARRVADDIGIDLFDSSTYEPSRLMYWPSAPRDVKYVFETGAGEPLDADRVLATYTDWHNVVEWPVDSRTAKVVKGRTGAKQEDPTEKGGIIGAFCRAYSITEAIEAFLSDIYVPTGHPDRWTYAAGSTEGGLVIYEDKWAYSHHGTDPCCEKLVNAFDMVRLHKFSEADGEADINTPVNRLPSFIKMEGLARSDAKVSRLMTREMLRSAETDFSGIDLDEADWRDDFMKDGKGKLLPNIANFGLIVRNDPGLKGVVRSNAFTGKTELTGDLPWRKMTPGSEEWNNNDYNLLQEYVCRSYAQLTGKQALLDAFDGAMSQNSVHPVRDYLNALQWDGTPRLDTLVIDYLGAEDAPVTRAMTRKHFTAAVARVMRPGIKYDYVLTLIGPEGIGKSTLIRLMAKMDAWFSDSLTNIDGREAMEQLRGKWLVEMGELTNYKRSTSEAYKAFLSKQDDSFRPAYGRKTETYPRQCIFFATTNEKSFLKGDTGNRRFWVIECGDDLPDKNIFKDLSGEVDQLWAEAVARWKAGEPLYLDPAMEAEARARQEDHNEVSSDERAGMIEAFIHKPVPVTWSSMSMDQRREWFQLNAEKESEGERVRRETICAVEILVELFGQRLDEKTRYRTKDINYILRRLDCVEYIGRARDKVYGLQHRFKILYNPE